MNEPTRIDDKAKATPTYVFNQNERRVIAAAKQKYFQTIQIIAELNGHTGNIAVVSDAENNDIGIMVNK